MPLGDQLVPLWVSSKYLPRTAKKEEEAQRQGTRAIQQALLGSLAHSKQKSGRQQALLCHCCFQGEGTELAPLSGSGIQGGERRNLSRERKGPPVLCHHMLYGAQLKAVAGERTRLVLQ